MGSIHHDRVDRIAGLKADDVSETRNRTIAQAEERFVGAILVCPAEIKKVRDLVPSDFQTERLRPIWGRLLDLADRDVTPTVVGVGAALLADGLLRDVGGAEFLNHLERNFAPPHDIQQDARRIRRWGQERRFQAAARRAVQDPDDPAARQALVAEHRALHELEVEKTSDPSVPRLLTADEFAQDVAPNSLVEGLIFEASTHNLTGASKTGKSWLVFQLAMAVASGRKFLGLDTRQVPVLLLSLELSAGMVRERMKQISDSVELPVPTIGSGMHIVAPLADYSPALNLGSDSGAERLKGLIAVSGARIVILDTLYRFLPGLDPNSNQEMGHVFGRLNEVAQLTGCALVSVDHVGKGEQLGPTSHSALGASVKGGASRVIIGLKRTTKEDGGRWELDVESHFGSWDEPIHYERPLTEDGERGFGCAVCSASHAWGLDLETVQELFERFAPERDEVARPRFPSKTKLIEGLIAFGKAGGNSDGAKAVKAIMRDFCIPQGSAWSHESRPIVTSDGPRHAIVFDWRGTN